MFQHEVASSNGRVGRLAVPGKEFLVNEALSEHRTILSAAMSVIEEEIYGEQLSVK